MISNPLTGKPYTGSNVATLAQIVLDNGYPTGEFITFRQALEMGRVVEKGQKGHKIVKLVDEEEDRQRAARNAANSKSRRSRKAPKDDATLGSKRGVRQYTVFNLAQTVELSTREKLSIKAGITTIEIPPH